MDVRLGVELDDGVPVVVKSASGPAAAALRHEHERLRRAVHPGVVALADRGTSRHEGAGPGDDEAGVPDAFELRTCYAGEPVARWTGTVATIAGLGAAVAATLDDLHALGVVHGRVDASHILIGDDGRPRLCGLSHPGDAAPADDVAALGCVVADLLARARSDRRGRRRPSRASLAGQRALLQVVERATDPVATRRPSARVLADAILAAVPGATLPSPVGPIRAAIATQPDTLDRIWSHAGHESDDERWRQAFGDGPLDLPATAAHASWDDRSGDDGLDRPPGTCLDDDSPVGLRTTPAPGASTPERPGDGRPAGSPAARTGHGIDADPGTRAGHRSAESPLPPPRIDTPAWCATREPVPTGVRSDSTPRAPSAVDPAIAGRPDPSYRDDAYDAVPARGSRVGALSARGRTVNGHRQHDGHDDVHLRTTPPSGHETLPPPGDDLTRDRQVPVRTGSRSTGRSAGERAARPGRRRWPTAVAVALVATGLAVAGAVRFGSGDDAAVPRPEADAAAAAGACPPAPPPAADVDGDDCPETLTVHGTTVDAGVARWSLGQPGDLVTVGDWDCDGAASAALLRPATGDVFMFGAWAPSDRPVTVRSTRRITGGVGIRAEPGETGCERLVVDLADGGTTTVEVPR